MTDDTWLRATTRRAGLSRIFDVGGSTVLVGADGHGHELHGDSAQLARVVLDLLTAPLTGEDLVAKLESLTGATLPRPAVVGELLELLRAAGAIETATPARSRPRPTGPGPRVLLGLTGAVASMHSPALVQHLQRRGFRVRVAATEGALRFVQREALTALTHERVATGIWPEDDELRVPHIELAQWADAVVVCPASATTLGRMANGDYGSLVAAIAQATRAPVMVVPSMNHAMLGSPAVRRNLERLIADGVHVVRTTAGIEVADRPDARTPAPGSAPPPSVVVPLVEAMLRRHGARPRRFPDAEDWDAMYRDHVPEALPWHDDASHEPLLATIERLAPPPASVLEIGTGLGTLAVALAQRGYRVLATDLSAVALSQARARAGDAPVIWLRDDVTDSRVRGRFELVVDRGCLPGLSGTQAEAWAKTVTDLVQPGGRLVLEVLAPEVAAARQLSPHDAASLAALLGPAFEPDGEPASTPYGRVHLLRRT